MIHRTTLSTTLLIAVRGGRRKPSVHKPAVAGIRVSIPQASSAQKSAHTVDANGNILPANSKPALV